MSEQKAKYKIAQLEQFGMYFDAEFLEPIRIRARASMYADLENVLTWREIHDEIPHGARVVAEKEFAHAAGCSPQTLRRKLAAVNGFPPEKLGDWVNAGLSWEHLQIAHDLAETARKTPRQLLDESVNPGNEHGETMTVNEMTAYALGEQVPKSETFAAVGWLSRLSELPAKLKWDAEKSYRFSALIEAIKEFLK